MIISKRLSEDWFCISKQCWPWWNAILCGISSWSPLFAKGPSIRRNNHTVSKFYILVNSSMGALFLEVAICIHHLITKQLKHIIIKQCIRPIQATDQWSGFVEWKPKPWKWPYKSEEKLVTQCDQKHVFCCCSSRFFIQVNNFSVMMRHFLSWTSTKKRIPMRLAPTILEVLYHWATVLTPHKCMWL